MRSLTGQADNKISLYLLGGVATAPNFMEDFLCELRYRLQLAEWEVLHTGLVFPYGDWSRRLVRQLHEMRRDLYPLWKKKSASVGGKAVAAAVNSTYRGGKVLLIGHSGGGLAGVHAAEILTAAGAVERSDLRIVQVGSPKCAVPEELRACTLYISSPRDPVTLLGHWGGWEQGSRGVPRWNPRKHAPSRTVRIPIIGKHADYFRRRSPYVNAQGTSNLELILQSIWTWLHEAEPERPGSYRLL